MSATAATLPPINAALAPHCVKTTVGSMLPQKTWLETTAIKNALAIMLAMKTSALCWSSMR
jgi:hypothetical protein